MSSFQKFALVLLRVALGWMFFYAGITKVLNPEWTAAGYIKAAKTLPDLYAFFLQPNVLPVIDFLNMWGLTLVGVALILGIGVRIASVGGLFIMMMYYLPILDFPHPNPNAYIVDQHVIYGIAFLTLMAFRAGRVFGLEKVCARLPFCSRHPKLRVLIG